MRAISWIESAAWFIPGTGVGLKSVIGKKCTSAAAEHEAAGRPLSDCLCHCPIEDSTYSRSVSLRYLILSSAKLLISKRWWRGFAGSQPCYARNIVEGCSSIYSTTFTLRLALTWLLALRREGRHQRSPVVTTSSIDLSARAEQQPWSSRGRRLMPSAAPSQILDDLWHGWSP